MRVLIIIAILASTTLFVSWRAADQQQEQTSAATKRDEGLEKEMKALKGAMRRIKRNLGKNDKKDAILAQIIIAQKSLVSAKGHVPKGLEKKEKAKERGEYRRLLIDCLGQSLELEKAVMASEWKKAEKAFKAMFAIEDKGHAKFRE